MKTLVTAIALLTAVPAFAGGSFDFQDATERWMAAQWSCRSGEDHEGGSIPWSEVEEACSEQKALQVALTDAGFCYAGDLQWTACK